MSVPATSPQPGPREGQTFAGASRITAYANLVKLPHTVFALPFALVGVVIGLAVTGLPLSMPVWLGIIMLIGVVVNNAIVLVEYIELLRERGAALLEAVVGAARLRLRPIMMTTLTTVAGMTPLALGLGEGSEMLQPLAVCMVSGLLFSMFVSLLLIPSLYVLAQPRPSSHEPAGAVPRAS